MESSILNQSSIMTIHSNVKHEEKIGECKDDNQT